MMGRGQRLFALLVFVVVGLLTTTVIAAPAKSATPTGKPCPMGDVAAADVVPDHVPVLLVHGIMAGPEMWWQKKISGQDITLWDKIKGESGAQPYAFSYKKAALSWVDDDRIGPALARTINCLKEASGRKVVIVAHSMGGLATQFALSQPIDSSKPCVQGKENCTATNVDRVVTLGTPFAGSLPLTVAQVARIGGDVTAVVGGIAGLAIAMEQILSLCALVGQASLALGIENICSVVAVPDSPVGVALQVPPLGRTKELPAWPSAVPLLAEAGSIDVDLSQLLVISISPLISSPLIAWPQTTPLLPVKIGDGVVMTDSSAGATTKPTTPVSCAIGSLEYVPAILSAFAMPACGHNALWADPALVGVILSAIHTAITQPKADNDWLNRTYQLSCDDISDKPIPVTLQNGQGTAGPNSGYDHWEVHIEARAAGSFDGLGSGTAVMFYCTPQPSNFFRQEVQVFHEDGSYVGRLRHLDPLPGGLSLTPVYDHDAFSVNNGLLNTGIRYYAGNDSHASGPSIPATLHWRWDGRQFVPTGIPATATAQPSPASQTVGGHPDLVPVSASAAPECGAVDLDGGVMNRSSLLTGSFEVAWVVDGAVVKTGTVTGLPTGVAKPALSVHQRLPGGNHTAKFVVDSSNVIPESDEGNNTWTQTVTVPDCTSNPSTSTPSTANPSPTRPTVLSPTSGQMLDFGGTYTVEVSPVAGASGYLYGFFQDGSPVWENYANEHQLSGTEYSVPPSGHAAFHPGPLDIWVRAYVNNQWTEASIVKVTLR
jgi:pimeloyl-ACP methyl ester carboxylesterase